MAEVMAYLNEHREPEPGFLEFASTVPASSAIAALFVTKYARILERRGG